MQHALIRRLLAERRDSHAARTTGKTIMAIAAGVGVTHSHLCRRFAQHFGTTPRLFRRDRST